MCTYLQAIKIHYSALWMELTELKNSIRQASQEAGISNGMSTTSMNIFVKFCLIKLKKNHS